MNSDRFVIFYDAEDYESSLDFYKNILGFPIINSYDEVHKRGTMFLVNPMCELEIMGTGKSSTQTHPAPQNVRLKFRVQDVDMEYKRLQVAAVKIIEEIVDKAWGERVFVIASPDGLLIHIYQERD